MKKTDLYKNLGLKINGQMKQAATPDRFGKKSTAGTAADKSAARLRNLFGQLAENSKKD